MTATCPLGRVKDEKSHEELLQYGFFAQFCMEKQNSLPF
jgi:hypothetical protein